MHPRCMKGDKYDVVRASPSGMSVNFGVRPTCTGGESYVCCCDDKQNCVLYGAHLRGITVDGREVAVDTNGTNVI